VFAALERNDLRCWPKGLFRRSFFRDYVGMIGLSVAETCAEFIRLFPDDEGAEAIKVVETVPRRSILDALKHLFGSSEDAPCEKIEEPEPRTWMSDARRVGPPRLRVRIKVSR
jgi:hypothetical protein